MHRNNTIRRWLAAACLSGLFTLPVQAGTPQPADNKPLASLQLQASTVSQSIHLDGSVEAVRESTVAAQTAGTVTRLYYDIGDQVKPGSVIVEISDSEQQARLAQAQAAARAALVNYRDAEQAFNRIDEIYRNELASKAQHDQARNRFDTAKANYRQARAALEEAKNQASYTKVIAPYGGVVTGRFVQIGERVAPGTPLMSGIDLEQLRISLRLPQHYAQAVRRLKLADVTLPDGSSVPAKKLTLYPYADSQSHDFQVRIDLPQRQTGLYPGMRVRVSLPVASRQALLLPESALIRRSELRAVYLLDKQGIPRLRQVRTGAVNADGIEILSGLEAGDRVVRDANAARQQLHSMRLDQDA